MNTHTRRHPSGSESIRYIGLRFGTLNIDVYEYTYFHPDIESVYDVYPQPGHRNPHACKRHDFLLCAHTIAR